MAAVEIIYHIWRKTLRCLLSYIFHVCGVHCSDLHVTGAPAQHKATHLMPNLTEREIVYIKQ